MSSSRVVLLVLMLVNVAFADEGMWLFTAPPTEALREKHGFTPSREWLDHLMRSAVKMGASGSFVSADGLLITNHHVGRGHIERLSTTDRNLLRDGFVAMRTSDELKCAGMEINVLESIEDVTARINTAVAGISDADAAARERRRVTAEIERQSLEQTGLRSDVVTLYQGGVYHLYRYRRFTDVRLVFAPEYAIAAFGGDADNFEYPRYCLDFCLFRVYENDQPYRPPHFLKWARKPVADGDLVFMAGHPGNTDRLLTTAELKHRRDLVLPFSQEGAFRSEVALVTWGARSAENQRRTAKYLPGIQNGRKSRIGSLAALQTPSTIASKEVAESEFREVLARAGETKAVEAFDRIADAQRTLAETHIRHSLLEGGGAFESALFTYARNLLRSAEERRKPDGERLAEFSEARKKTFELTLFAETPVYADLETVRLANSLGRMVEHLGADDPTVRRVLGGKSPAQRAAELVSGSSLGNASVRRQLYAASSPEFSDPMLALARDVDAEARELRRRRDAITETIKQAHGEIAAARFRLQGTSSYPDATGTLRLSYGRVKGYEEGAERLPAMTQTSGLFARAKDHEQRPPFNLPPRWRGKDNVLGATTPFNFVATGDIVGGNSGSPVVNRDGEFVGIIFDGNLHSLSFAYAYEETHARCISVHASIITECLRKIYDAPHLASELERGKK